MNKVNDLKKQQHKKLTDHITQIKLFLVISARNVISNIQ